MKFDSIESRERSRGRPFAARERHLHVSSIALPDRGAQNSADPMVRREQTLPLIILDEETLQILGEDPRQPTQKSVSLHQAICSRWEHLISIGQMEDSHLCKACYSG